MFNGLRHRRVSFVDNFVDCLWVWWYAGSSTFKCRLSAKTLEIKRENILRVASNKNIIGYQLVSEGENRNMKKIPASSLAQMANFSLRLDGIFWIVRFFPRTPVDILYISRINSIASRQFGAVSRQYGAVSRQYGAVRGQYGAVRGLFSEFSIFFCFYFFSAPYFTAHCSILPAGYLWYQYFHQHKFF